MEEWKTIPGYAPYEASTLGRIRRGERVLNGFLDKNGYWRISVAIGKVKQIPVHTLILFAFVGPRPTPAHTVAHGDGIKTNNTPGNLRWATMPEQYQDRIRHGTHVSAERHPRRKLTLEQVEFIRANYRARDKEFGGCALAKKFNISRGSIDHIVHRDGWRP